MNKNNSLVKALIISGVITFILSVVIMTVPVTVYRSANDYPAGVSDLLIVSNQPRISRKEVDGGYIYNTLKDIYFRENKIAVTLEYENGEQVAYFDDRYDCDNSIDHIVSITKRGKEYIGPNDKWTARYRRDDNDNIYEINYKFEEAEPKRTIASMLFESYEDSKSWSFFIFSSEQFRVIPIEVEMTIFYILLVIIPFVIIGVLTYLILRGRQYDREHGLA